MIDTLLYLIFEPHSILCWFAKFAISAYFTLKFLKKARDYWRSKKMRRERDDGLIGNGTYQYIVTFHKAEDIDKGVKDSTERNISPIRRQENKGDDGK